MEKPKRARRRKPETAKAVLKPSVIAVGRTTQGGKPMAQQKSEDRIVPEGHRKLAPTRELECSGGGRAVPVKGEDQQLKLSFATAENSRVKRGAEGVAVPDRSGTKTRKAPKAEDKRENASPARMKPPGCKSENRVARCLCGTKVPVGAEPRPCGRPRTPQRVFRQTGVRFAQGMVRGDLGGQPRSGAACAEAGTCEVVTRPAAGVITRRPEEPYVKSTSTVLWELGRATAPATRPAAGELGTGRNTGEERSGPGA